VKARVSIQALTHFATTRWNLIRMEQAPPSQRAKKNALADLCEIYWRPIFTFICRQGYSIADAQDLTQEFFGAVFEDKLLHSADPRRGRFRSLLLKSLKNFLVDRHIKSRREKRGGKIQFISWDEGMDEASQLCVSRNGLAQYSDDSLFDLRWAATIADQALRRLREKCESKGHRRLFEILRDYLTADRSDVSYRHLSILLGVPEDSVKRLMHQFRLRYRVFLREEIRKTVESLTDVDGEIRYFCSVLGAPPHNNGHETS